jgi:thiamine-monophosphate kinase
MLDISDGLAADAGHLAAASGVRCELWADAIPRVSGASVEDALASGEEYELLVATDADLDSDEFERRFGVPLTRVGRVLPGSATPEERLVVLREGSAGDETSPRVDLPPGHDHFSG